MLIVKNVKNGKVKNRNTFGLLGYRYWRFSAAGF